MKTHAIGIAALVFPIVFSTMAHAQTMRLGEVLVFNVPDLKPDADAKAFESHVANQIASMWTKIAPGIGLSLVRKDRGPHPGRYLLAWSMDSARRQTYTGEFQPDLTPFVGRAGHLFEYQLVAPEKAGALPEVDVLGIHYIKVRPDRRDAFDRFIANTLHPAVANLRPDLRLLYYKPLRGTDAGNYITIFALTRQSRDKYWPKGKDSQDLIDAFQPVQALTDELKTYLVDGSYATGNLAAAVYESREWADWITVAMTAR
jgi:hypothetical protein